MPLLTQFGEIFVSTVLLAIHKNVVWVKLIEIKMFVCQADFRVPVVVWKNRNEFWSDI